MNILFIMCSLFIPSYFFIMDIRNVHLVVEIVEDFVWNSYKKGNITNTELLERIENGDDPGTH